MQRTAGCDSGMRQIEKHYAAHIDRVIAVASHAIDRHGFDGLAISSGFVRSRFQDDTPYPFHTNPYFRYVVPLLDAPNSWVVFRPDRRPELIVCRPGDFWHAEPSRRADCWHRHFDVVEAKTVDDGHARLPSSARLAVIGEPETAPDDTDRIALNPAGLIHELNWARSYKSDYEIACIERANRISVKGYIAARDAFLSGCSEFETARAFEDACGQSSDELAYPSVVAFNENAAVLHYFARGRTRCDEAGARSCLIDAGASFNGYASDISRTYARSAGVFADMVRALDQAQQALAASLKAGVAYLDFNVQALTAVGTILSDVGILTVPPEDAVASGVASAFMPHGIGHFLGAQVHDVASRQTAPDGQLVDPDPRFPFMRLLRDADAGHVVTVEPGIYFIDLLLEKLRSGPSKDAVDWRIVEQLRPFGGIRIEDDVAITAQGPENLTRAAFSRHEAGRV